MPTPSTNRWAIDRRRLFEELSDFHQFLLQRTVTTVTAAFLSKDLQGVRVFDQALDQLQGRRPVSVPLPREFRRQLQQAFDGM